MRCLHQERRYRMALGMDRSVSIVIDHTDPKAWFEKASKPDMEVKAGQAL